jgi:hypothetical protein
MTMIHGSVECRQVADLRAELARVTAERDEARRTNVDFDARRGAWVQRAETAERELADGGPLSVVVERLILEAREET